MSRCFPFPPPGYILNGIRDEAMIESIKGAEEKAKKDRRRKEKKRDKNEKKEKKDKKDKKDKKEKKRKEREERGDGESEKHSHKRRRKEEGVKDGQNQKFEVFPKLKERENECLEKSSLTVERELLQSTSQNSCDSTLNSNEKQPLDARHSSLNSNELLPKQPVDGRHNTLNSSELLPKQPLDGRHNNNDSESIIRIRLPLRRQRDPEVMMTTTNKDQQKPREIKLDSSQLQKPLEMKLDSSQLSTRELQVNQQHPCSTSAPEHASKPLEEKRKDDPISTMKPGKEKKKSSTSSTPGGASQHSGLCSICPPSMALQFLNVVENWVPNTIQRRIELTNSEDEECWWLMKKPSSHTESCKQVNRNNESKQVMNSSKAWPCARLLPEADVYALPYTVPF
uniref:Uncharacterized protein n=1 Tax=Noccaea caerulescens TaxID=107243 RepID=A0A1J3DLD5_NOCCA